MHDTRGPAAGPSWKRSPAGCRRKVICAIRYAFISAAPGRYSIDLTDFYQGQRSAKQNFDRRSLYSGQTLFVFVHGRIHPIRVETNRLVPVENTDALSLSAVAISDILPMCVDFPFSHQTPWVDCGGSFPGIVADRGLPG
jgi:hypothetical protein